MTIWYAKPTATGSGNGSSWANADTLKGVLEDQSVQPNDEVWVASGLHQNIGGGTYAFLLPTTVSLYGGFKGDETQRSQRDYDAYRTILNGHDGTQRADYVIANDTSTAGDHTYTIDGFTIESGHTGFYGEGLSGGAGTQDVFLYANNCHFTDSVVDNAMYSINNSNHTGPYFIISANNCTFEGTTTGLYSSVVSANNDGIVYTEAKDSIFKNVGRSIQISDGSDNLSQMYITASGCSFINGTDSQIKQFPPNFVNNRASEYKILDCKFINCMVSQGVNVLGQSASYKIYPVVSLQYEGGTARIERCSFIGSSGTPVFLQSIYNNCISNIENCELIGGISDTYSAAIALDDTGPDHDISIVNCTFWRNVSSGDGGSIWTDASDSHTIKNNIFFGNVDPSGYTEIYTESSAVELGISYCDIQGGLPSGVRGFSDIIADSGGNIAVDPLFKVMPSGYSTGGIVYNSQVSQSTIKDWSASFSASVSGSIIQPNINERLHFSIIHNTANEVTVWGNALSVANSGDPYQIISPKLQKISPCIDSATSVGAPTGDISWVFRPQAAGFDMGAYELEIPVANIPLFSYGVGLIKEKRRVAESTHLVNVDTTFYAIYGGQYTAIYTPDNRLVNDQYTSLLLNMDSENESQVFVDSSFYNNDITSIGGISANTSNFKFGSASAYFNGIDAYLSVASSSLWDFGTNDFTIDLWVYMTTNASIMVGGDIGKWTWGVDSSNNIGFGVYGVDNVVTTGGPVTFNTWHHIAITRESGVIYIFVDGDLKKTQAYTTNLVHSYLHIGHEPNRTFSPEVFYAGYMDDVRISNYARWTSNFTVPTPTYAFTTSKIYGDGRYDGSNYNIEMYADSGRRYRTLEFTSASSSDTNVVFSGDLYGYGMSGTMNYSF